MDDTTDLLEFSPHPATVEVRSVQGQCDQASVTSRATDRLHCACPRLYTPRMSGQSPAVALPVSPTCSHSLVNNWWTHTGMAEVAQKWVRFGQMRQSRDFFRSDFSTFWRTEFKKEEQQIISKYLQGSTAIFT